MRQKKPLDEESFWKIIEQTVQPGSSVAAQEQRLHAVLAQLSEPALLGCYYINWKLSEQDYRDNLWAVAYTVLGGCGDDGFDDFRAWLICQGRTVFETALSDPDSLCDIFEQISEGDIPSMDGLGFILRSVFEVKFAGRDLHEAFGAQTLYPSYVERPPLASTWNGEDEDSLRAVCPRTFERWWGNTRF